ncbi:MAG: helix-hairpin-helix domain-containing protein [Flavobacteriales bacterium]|nr:helix-hairpin-helix domain-containing protein [Flavobacteriales bacterium]MBK6893693.1 helix-hairpin-helix domain-containing protein [Flavobacteriales bacterium]MBK7248596.1 helix-hairpin-helix domain-containing protein [Flavobacteriales bacterium]MBK9059176.1 helix-hairpin-helix domain-containing protein [Flavobacteriales bacterium]MBK9597883.1 helix-hairpin-helix domain-containing protein [Flavobacteriales bacterium]
MARRRRARPWREELKDLFAMHRGERRAFAVLLLLCLIGAAWVTWEQWLRPRTLADKDQLEVAWWEMQDSTSAGKALAGKSFDDIHLFKFDPNGLPVEQWTELGLSEKQAGAIHRYEERGGKFRTKKDVAKMRVVDPELYAQWEPFILLPDSLPRKEWKTYAKQDRWPRDSSRWGSRDQKPFSGRENATPIELNGADSATLVTIRGIGPSFARGIIKYRDRLGGFVSLDQLSEVYILRDKPDAVERIKPKLTLDPALVKYFPLNTCTAEDLGPHPYCGWKVAKALIAYRDHHGPFPDVAAISNCVLVTDSIRMRLSPYLTVGP